MTPDDAHKIEQAAIVLLRLVEYLGNEAPEVRAALRNINLDVEFANRVNIHTARELLESTTEWPRAIPQYIACDHCGEPVTVLFQPADTLAAAAQPATEQSRPCPHGCGHVDHRQLRGLIIEVWRGHSPEPEVRQ